jgi:basic amino acid/polyamine antiporter, APA family
MINSDPTPTVVVPFWKVMVLGFCAMQLGPNLALSAGYQLHYSGLLAWVALGGATFVSMAVAAAISLFARQFSVTASILSFAQIALPRGPVAITAATLLLGYIMGPPIGILTATIYLLSLIHSLGYSWADGPYVPSVVAALSSLVVGACAYRGVDWSAKIAIVLGIACLPLALFVTWAAGRSFGFDIRPELSLGNTSLISLSRGIFVAMGFYVGFDGVGALASETSEPKRNVPRILKWSLALAGLTLVAGALLQAPVLMAHSSELAAGASPSKILADAGGIPTAAIASDLLLSMACVSGLIAWLNCAAIVVATAAKDGFLPRYLSHFNRQTGSPRHAIIFLTIVSMALSIVLLGWTKTAPIVTTTYITNINVLLWLIPYALICAAAVRYRVVGQRRGLSHVFSGLGLATIIAIIGAQILWPLDHISAVINTTGSIVVVVGSLIFWGLTPPTSGQLPTPRVSDN